MVIASYFQRISRSLDVIASPVLTYYDDDFEINNDFDLNDNINVNGDLDIDDNINFKTMKSQNI